MELVRDSDDMLGDIGVQKRGKDMPLTHEHHKELSVSVVRAPPPTRIKAADEPSRVPVCCAGTERPRVR